MFNILKETFLFEYFTHNSIVGAFFDSKDLFLRLGELFGLTKVDLEGLFQKTQSPAVLDIVSAGDYKRYKRIKQYYKMVEEEQECTSEEDSLISIKGNAISEVCEQEMKVNEDSTATLAVKHLMEKAQEGNVLALRVLGILQCEGILLDKNLESGTENLKKAMRWGDVIATIAMLKYSLDDKYDLLMMLNAAVKNTPYEFFVPLQEKAYDLRVEGECNQELLLLRRAISAKKVEQGVFDPLFARIVYSMALGIKDKEKILFAANKEMISEACDLPLRLSLKNIDVDEQAIENLPFERKEEKRKVRQWLSYSNVRWADIFRPLCMCSNSEYLLNSYASAVCKALGDVNVERINVGDLQERDFELNKNNVFLRGLDERKNNVFLLVFTGDINSTVMEYAMAIMQTAKRCKFRLNHPAVTIDLSSVLPICICDKKNAQKLRNLVELVELASLRPEEKESALKNILEKESKAYETGEISLSKEVLDKLCDLPIETAERIIDKTVRANRQKGVPLCLNMELVKPYITNFANGTTAYGFGGDINENK